MMIVRILRSTLRTLKKKRRNITLALRKKKLKMRKKR